SKKSRQRPSSLPAHRANRRLIPAIDIRTLIAVHLHCDEMLIHNRRHVRIVVRLAVHHMAPVAPHRANVKQHRLVFALRGGKASGEATFPLNTAPTAVAVKQPSHCSVLALSVSFFLAPKRQNMLRKTYDYRANAGSRPGSRDRRLRLRHLPNLATSHQSTHLQPRNHAAIDEWHGPGPLRTKLPELHLHRLQLLVQAHARY